MKVRGINNTAMYDTKGLFTAPIIDDTGAIHIVEFKNSLQPPDKEDLISWMFLKEKGWELYDTKAGANIITPTGQKVTLIRKRGFLYVPLIKATTKKSLTLLQIHEGLNHPIATVPELKKRAAQLNINVLDEQYECTQCTLQNVHHKRVRTFSLTRSLVLFFRVYVDLFGPFPTSKKGNRYGIQIVDECSRLGYVNFIRSRAEKDVLPALKQLLEQASSTHQAKVVVLRHDGEKALTGKAAQIMKEEQQWREERVSPNTPEQQSVVERRIVVNWLRVVKMYQQAEVWRLKGAHSYIEELYRMSNIAGNYSNTAANGDRAPPMTIAEVLTGRKLTTLPLIAFGTLVTVPKEGKKKGSKYSCEDKGRYAMCIGYAPHMHHAARFQFIDDKRLIDAYTETEHYDICVAPFMYASQFITSTSNIDIDDSDSWLESIINLSHI